MKMIMWVVSILSISLLGCTTHAQLRGTASPLRTSLDSVEDSTPDFQKKLASTSIEQYVDFTLGVIEMSDDGHIKDMEQKAQVFSMVKEKSSEQGAILVIFVHGWHHGARACDSNINCYRRVLERITYLNPDEKRPVIGIYIGWRGDSCGVRHLNALTFWNRKRAANHIGEREGRDLLLDFDALYQEIQHTKPITMVIVGHSFGGELVYSAVETKMLIETKGRDVVGPLASPDEASRGVKPLRRGLGDLVVLVNPAVEARRYKAFDEDVEAAGRFQETQPPVLVTVASKADVVVRFAFPVGRWLRTIVNPFLWRDGKWDRVALGHYKKQITHELTYSGPPKIAPPYESTCVCTSIHADQTPLKPMYEQVNLRSTQPQELAEHLRLIPVNGKARENSPYMVIRTESQVIGDHNDIFNPILLDFLFNYLGALPKREGGR